MMLGYSFALEKREIAVMRHDSTHEPCASLYCVKPISQKVEILRLTRGNKGGDVRLGLLEIGEAPRRFVALPDIGMLKADGWLGNTPGAVHRGEVCVVQIGLTDGRQAVIRLIWTEQALSLWLEAYQDHDLASFSEVARFAVMGKRIHFWLGYTDERFMRCLHDGRVSSTFMPGPGQTGPLREFKVERGNES